MDKDNGKDNVKVRYTVNNVIEKLFNFMTYFDAISKLSPTMNLFNVGCGVNMFISMNFAIRIVESSTETSVLPH